MEVQAHTQCETIMFSPQDQDDFKWAVISGQSWSLSFSIMNNILDNMSAASVSNVSLPHTFPLPL